MVNYETFQIAATCCGLLLTLLTLTVSIVSLIKK